MKYTIATIGSHSALQILKGAKDEGFATLCFVLRRNLDFYQNYDFIDKFEVLDDFDDLLALENKFVKSGIVMVPHGSFVAYLGKDFDSKTKFKYFGNKKILEIEADRNMQAEWLDSSGILTPKKFVNADSVDRPVIIKTFGARGGMGYIISNGRKSLKKAIGNLGKEKYIIQEYVIGTPVYIQFFYSPLDKNLEILGCDRRYESDVDGIGRITSKLQNDLNIEPTFTVIGNFPIVLRESLLPKIYEYGKSVVEKSGKLASPLGLYGPFCLETVITPDLKVYAIEISARIVAGTNAYINGSPYSDLLFGKPVSMGRRIAMEIKKAVKSGNLETILT